MPAQREIIKALVAAVDGWQHATRGGDATYVCPYWIEQGGEGCVLAAERHLPDPGFGAPCASYVALKLPLSLAGDAPGTLEIKSDAVARARAEHERRARLGRLPHLGEEPEIQLFPLARLRAEGVAVALEPHARGDDLPILVTPLRVDRGGGPVPITLHDALSVSGCWSSRDLQNFRTVARALSLALWSMHANGWAHNDVKPKNVVLYQTRGVFHDVNLIDFGLLGPDFAQPMTFSTGTPGYARPERFDRPNAALGRTGPPLSALRPSTEDAYALGVLLVELLLGKRRRAEIRARAIRRSQGPAGPEYGRLIRDEARRHAAERAGIPAARSVAFQLCANHLLRWPPPESTGVDLLRTFLAALDAHLPPATAAAGAFWPLASQIRSLRELGDNAAPTSPDRYVSPSAPETRPPAGIADCAELLRLGYGRVAERGLFEVLVARVEDGAPPPRDRREAYEIAHGLRIYAGLLMVRESRFSEAYALLARAHAFAAAAPGGEARDILLFWIDHLRRRTIQQAAAERRRAAWYAHRWGEVEAEARSERPSPPSDFTFPTLAHADARDRRELERARAWHVALEHDAALRRREPIGETLEAMILRSDAVESPDEPTWGALQIWSYLQMARAGLVSALDGCVEAWGAILPTLFLAANWALVRSLHHEYASALVVTAASVRAAFRGGDAGRTEAGASPAEIAEHADAATRSENAAERPPCADEPPPRPFSSRPPPPDLARGPRALTEHLRRGGADREECLIAAAECALTAAEVYDRLDVPTKGWQARMLAAESYRFCEAPENCALSLRWLSLAHNHAVLRGQEAPPAEHQKRVETACAAWRAVAEPAYKGTAGEDPGAFLSRAMINRYGVGLWQLFGGSLAVEMRDQAGQIQNGAAFARLFALGRAAGIPALARPEEEALLELDCGYGRDSIAAAREGFRTVTGIDRMEYCIRHARRSIEGKRELARRVSFVRADPTGPHLPWSESFYGVVLARDVLTRVTDKARVLARARTALRPGGALLLTEWVQVRPTSHATWSTLCDAAWLTGLSTREGYERLLESAGFAVEAAVERKEDMHAFFAGGAALATQMNGMDPTLDPAALERAQSDLRLLAGLSGPEGPLGWVLIVARRV